MSAIAASHRTWPSPSLDRCFGQLAFRNAARAIHFTSSHNANVDHCCHAWNQLVDQPWRVMSIGLRDWAMSQTQ